MDSHYERCAGDSRDWRNITNEAEIEVIVEGSVDRIRRADGKECIAIWRRTDDRFGGDISGSAWPIFHDELLTEMCG